MVDGLHAIMNQLSLQPDNIYNCVEIGIALGACTNSRRNGTSSRKNCLVKSSEDREWVSIIETISTSGAKLKPLVVFKDQARQCARLAVYRLS